MDNEYSSFYLYRKYEIIGDELIDLGITSIDADGTQEPVMKEECDPACGCPIEPIYRWVQTEDTVCVGEEPAVQYRWTPSGWTCVGYDKYQNNIKEQSTDGGETWTVVIPEEYSASTLIESQSTDCGYVPPTPIDGKFKLTLSDSSIVTAECDASSAITSGEVSAYTSSVESVVIGDCVKTIGYDTFMGSTGLTSVTIPNSITSIGGSAFYNCSGLTSVNIPSGVGRIGYKTFNNCASLTSVIIPDSVRTVDLTAFKNCISLTSVTIGSGVTTIGTSVFENCSGLTSVIIPDSVTLIGSYSFERCYSLTSVTIGSGVTEIQSFAFTYCTGLTSVIIGATTPPTLTNTNVFVDTNNCPIYVPSGSVNAYKSASGWSNYASRIQAIP